MVPLIRFSRLRLRRKIFKIIRKIRKIILIIIKMKIKIIKIKEMREAKEKVVNENNGGANLLLNPAYPQIYLG